MNRKRTRQPNRRDAGETLIEVLITMIIVGVAISALVAGIATSVLATSRHRDHATANALLRSYAEAVKENARTGYIPCASSYDNLDGRYAQPAGWDEPTNEVIWEGGCTDNGLQHVRVSVMTPKGVEQSLDLWIRRTTT
jgi:type II secretory pathway pseudopilin PulG